MGLRDITSGEKLANVKGARFIESKGGTPAIEVAFEFTEPSSGTVEHMTWAGWLTENALKNTMKTLVDVLGYNGSDAVDENGMLTDPNVFDFSKQVKLVIELEEQKNDDGTVKTNAETGEIVVYPKIKWVNSLGGSGYTGMTVEKVKSAVASTGFKAAFLQMKGAQPLPKPAASNPPPQPINNMAPAPAARRPF